MKFKKYLPALILQAAALALPVSAQGPDAGERGFEVPAVVLVLVLAMVLALAVKLRLRKGRPGRRPRRRNSEQTDRTAVEQAGARGEKEVDHRIQWWLPEHRGWQAVRKDCRGKYSDRCILLQNRPQFPEKQEYDHILVGPGGVILIETKNYGGEIQVVNNETWRRRRTGETGWKQEESPAYQVHRHELLLKSLLDPKVPVKSIICIANDATRIQNAQRSRYPIVPVRELARALDRLSAASRPLSPAQVKAVQAAIEKAKTGRGSTRN